MTIPHPKGEFDTSKAVWQGAPDDGGDGVQVAFVGDLIGVRNAADPDGPILVFDQGEWDAFVEGAKDGEFDID